MDDTSKQVETATRSLWQTTMKTNARLCPQYTGFEADIADGWFNERRPANYIPYAQSSSGITLPKLGVIIGGLLRLPQGFPALDAISDSSSDWRLFMGLDVRNLPPSCRARLCELRHLQSLSVISSGMPAYYAEIDFGAQLSAPCPPRKRKCECAYFPFPPAGMQKQFFGVARAYDVLKDYEASAKMRFTAVLRFRSDFVVKPLRLDYFPEISKRVAYAITDYVCMSNRDVAEDLWTNLTERMLATRGADYALLPIQYEQILQSELDHTRFHILNYPHVPAAEPSFSSLLAYFKRFYGQYHDEHRSVHIARRLEKWKALIRGHLAMFEAHNALGVQPGLKRWAYPTGAFWHSFDKAKNMTVGDVRFNSRPTVEPRCNLNSSMPPEKMWFYIVNQIKPPIVWRRWPLPIRDTRPRQSMPHQDRKGKMAFCTDDTISVLA